MGGAGAADRPQLHRYFFLIIFAGSFGYVEDQI